MDPSRFDAVAKALAARRRRRGIGAYASAGPGALAVGPGTRAGAQDGSATPVGTPAGTPDAEDVGEDAAFLFVQTFASGSFAPNPGAGTPAVRGAPAAGGGAAYLLTLEGHPGGTVYFSDRPDRIFGEAPTQDFLDGLGFSPANPPNAALVAQTDAGDAVVVLELLEPAYNAGAGTLTYGAEILAEYAGEGLAHVAERQLDEALPEQFGRASLFIDDCLDIDTCLGYCGREQCSYGPVPGGPYGTCWSWSPPIGCYPCRDYGNLDALCNTAYPACNGFCKAY